MPAPFRSYHGNVGQQACSAFQLHSPLTMHHFPAYQCRPCLPTYATTANLPANSRTSGLGSEIRLRRQDSAISSLFARTSICHQTTHSLAHLPSTMSLENSKDGRKWAYQHSSSHKHKHSRWSAPYSPSPLVRMCIAVLDARLYAFVSPPRNRVERGVGFWEEWSDIRQLQRAPSTLFSLPALSQLHFSADCFPHEQVAWEAQTQAAPERPQQVEGMVMFEDGSGGFECGESRFFVS